MIKYRLILLAILMSACSTAITAKGNFIRPVNSAEKEKYSCSFLGMVTASHGMGWSNGDNQESALNEARNKVADLGGNAMTILSSDGGTAFVPAVTFNVEALKCNFKK